MSRQQERKQKGIREIAEALGISIGTVDRALHGREGVSARTRDRVLKLAEQFEYKPNIAARNLKLNRQIKLGVYLPQRVASYYEALREGIRRAAQAEDAAHVEVEFFDYPSLGVGDAEAMRKSDWLRFDGIILAPGHPRNLQAISAAAVEHGKTIVCVTTDAPRLHRLASVTADSFISGSMAAELLGSWIQSRGDVVMFTGDLEVQDHADKLRGFAGTLAMHAPHLRLTPTVESHDSPREAYAAAKEVLRSYAELRGVYVNTANSLPVLEALSESGRLKSLRVITTDLYPELIPYVERGEVSASLYQRPHTQGKLALEVLCAFLTKGIQPKQELRLAPHIIVRSNLSLFADSLSPSSIR